MKFSKFQHQINKVFHFFVSFVDSNHITSWIEIFRESKGKTDKFNSTSTNIYLGIITIQSIYQVGQKKNTISMY